MRNIVLIIGLMACTSLQAQGFSSNNKIDLSGQWRFSQGDAPTYEDVVKLPGSMLTNGKGNDVCTHTQWTGSLYDSSFYFNPYMEKYRQEEVLANGKHRIKGTMKFPFFLTPEKHYIGNAWYRKSVFVPKEWKKQRVILYLERPHIETSVYVNGKLAGRDSSLSVPHEFDVTPYIIYGKDNEISIKVYNGIENVCVGQDSHSVTDQTQGNWNGIIGKMELQAHQQQYIRNLQVYPDVKGKQIKVVMDVTGNVQKADFQFDVSGVKHSFSKIKRESDGKFSVIIPMGEDIRLWDEFHPNLYTLTATTGNFATQTENRNINQKNKNNYQTKKNMKRLFTLLSAMIAASITFAQQSMTLDGSAAGKRFDGIGMVNGGGATAVLLKDYPEPQRSQIMDLVYRPMFGASVSSLLVEIPGDGNSTQGSMPSHEHEQGKVNYHRGYMWWVLTEAKRRNPDLTLDGAAWSAPGWIGNGKFFSQDGADYYVSWLRGLRGVYGLEMDAIGCRNEKGQSYDFAKRLRKTLNENGFQNVKLHAFDNWYPGKLDFVKDMEKDSELRDAIDIISGHIFFEGEHVSPEIQATAERLGKPIWNSEDHIYLKGFDCLITLVKCFNQNFIQNGVTKIINWYDIAGTYPMEPYSEDPPVIHAYEPWSGHYRVRQALWGYAHYGQFTRVGWDYIASGCKNLDSGGSVVTLASHNRKDYSLIIETKGAEKIQTLTLDIKKLPKGKLCVWKSNENEQFVRMADVKPCHGKLTLTLEPNTVYSVSTLKGQQKGSFSDIPASQPFPFPYTESFDEYTDLTKCGYLPRYTADICGAFELEDGALHQVVSKPAISWAPDWHYYTIIGDSAWRNYEVSADIMLTPGDDAGIMGRICDVGSGYGFIPKGYYLQLNDSGRCQLVVVRGKLDKKKLVGDAEQQAKIKAMNDNSEGGEKILSTTQIEGISAGTWHNLKLRFHGSQIDGFVDGKQVLSVTNSLYGHGMAGLLAIKFKNKVSTPYFDNLQIK